MATVHPLHNTPLLTNYLSEDTHAHARTRTRTCAHAHAHAEVDLLDLLDPPKRGFLSLIAAEEKRKYVGLTTVCLDEFYIYIIYMN